MSDELIERLKEHCRTLPGFTEENRYDGQHEFALMDGSLDGFAAFIPGEPVEILLRVKTADRVRVVGEGGSIGVSDRMHWDTQGWDWSDVVLDGSISESTLVDLISASYQIVYDAADEELKLTVSLLDKPWEPSEILKVLTDSLGISERCDEIRSLLKTGVMLKTYSAERVAIPIGQTRIGGNPDLPADWQWPTHEESGSLLTFFAQVNLAEVQSVAPIEGLPAKGMLYFFSFFDWENIEDGEAFAPYDFTAEDGWVRVIHCPDTDVKLSRRPLPEPNGQTFQAFEPAVVELIESARLPSAEESVVAALGWDDETIEKYDYGVAMTFHRIFRYQQGDPAEHLFRGYASYEQGAIPEVLENGLTLLMQISYDEHTQMEFGDGGYAYFFIDPNALADGKFEDVFVDTQCG